MSPEATLKEVMQYLEMEAKTFMVEWRKLDEESKHQLRIGIANGSLTY